MMTFPRTPEQREAYRAESQRAADRARAALKPGDRIRVTRCGGGSPTYTFAGWVAHGETPVEQSRCMISVSGVDDLSPVCIFAVNGKPTSFRDDPAAHLANPFDHPEAA